VCALIKQSSLDALLDVSDIVEVVSGYTSLRKRGATHSGLCPFHQEKTPSFTVSADKGLYYCFGCGEGGNVFTFLEHIESLSFVEAAEQLAQRFAVVLEYEDGGGADLQARGGEKRLLDLLEKTATFYQRFLWESKDGARAQEYLESRGLRRDVCGLFRVGLAPAGWHGLYGKAREQGFTEQELEAAGLMVRGPGKTYDRFRARLMFPLVDHRGRVVGFGGRSLGDESPKYLNSSEGPVYRKGRLLYGLFQARKAIAEADEVLVVEGYTDVLGLSQADVHNAVASMGTALTDGQLDLLARFTRNVSFMFDADRAGAEAAVRSGDLARRHGFHPMVVALPAGSDPADVATSGGAEAVARLTRNKLSLLGYELRRALDSGDVATVEGRVRAFDVVREILSRAGSPKEREEEMRVVADRLRLTSDSIELLLRTPATTPGSSTGRVGRRMPFGSAGAGPARWSQGDVPTAYRERLRSPEATVEREFLVAAFSHPEAAVPLLEGITPEHFVDPLHRDVFLGLHRMLTSPDPAREVTSLAGIDTDMGRFFVRLAVEADSVLYSAAVLGERHLRLQEQFLAREGADLRRSLEEDSVEVDTEQRLLRLEQLLHQVRAAAAGLEEE
jgi:DNA primase